MPDSICCWGRAVILGLGTVQTAMTKVAGDILTMTSEIENKLIGIVNIKLPHILITTYLVFSLFLREEIDPLNFSK